MVLLTDVYIVFFLVTPGCTCVRNVGLYLFIWKERYYMFNQRWCNQPFE